MILHMDTHFSSAVVTEPVSSSLKSVVVASGTEEGDKTIIMYSLNFVLYNISTGVQCILQVRTRA